MKPRKILCALVAGALLALPVAAQTPKPVNEADEARRNADAKALEEQMRKAEQDMKKSEREMQNLARKLAELHAGRARDIARRVVVINDRARLGLVLRTESDEKTDLKGATVQGLTPGGPAEEAGLQVGDVITKFNNEPLAGAKVDVDEDESAPASKLMGLAGNLKDGDKVTIEYLRGGKTQTATVTARRLAGPRVRMFTPEHFDVDVDVDVPDVPDFNAGDWEQNFEKGYAAFSRSWRDMELVALSPELGEYFGTKEGLLVVRAPEEKAFQLKAGDVILKIGGRAPATPTQAMRILRSYDTGESVNFDIVRKHEKTTLAVVVPEKHNAFEVHVMTPKPPKPPRAPAPPAQPAQPPSPHDSV